MENTWKTKIYLNYCQFHIYVVKSDAAHHDLIFRDFENYKETKLQGKVNASFLADYSL